MIASSLFTFFLVCFWLETVLGVELSFVTGLSLQNAAFYFMILFWLVTAMQRRRLFEPCKLNKYILLFIAIAVVSIPIKYFLGEVPNFSWLHELIFFKSWADPYLLFFILYNIAEDQKTADRLLYILIIFMFITVISTVAVVSDFLTIGSLRVKEARSAGFAEPNQYASYIALFFPLLFSFFFTLRHKLIKIFPIILIILAVISLLMTGSRGGFIALFFGMVIYFYLLARHRMTRVLPVIMVAVLLLPLISAAGFYLSPKEVRNSVVERFDPSQSEDIDKFTSGRTVLWPQGFKLFLASPVYGYGQNSFIPLMKKNFRIGGNSHNDYLMYAVHFGLIGLIVFLMIFYSLYRSSKNLIHLTGDKKVQFFALGYLAGLAAYMVAMFGVNILTPRYLFWAYSAIALKYVQLESTEVNV